MNQKSIYYPAAALRNNRLERSARGEVLGKTGVSKVGSNECSECDGIRRKRKFHKFLRNGRNFFFFFNFPPIPPGNEFRFQYLNSRQTNHFFFFLIRVITGNALFKKYKSGSRIRFLSELCARCCLHVSANVTPRHI